MAGMFVGAEVRAEVSAAVAAARLASLTLGSALIDQSHQAWTDGFAWVGPVPALSKLVLVQFSEPVRRGAVTVLAVRWEATGVAGRVFPVLDADITLAPDGDEATLLGLDGVYGPPGGAVGAGLDRLILHRIATATVRSFLTRVADAIASQPPVAGRSELRLPGVPT